MMNTIEYRVDCQLLQYLHWENALGCRFPIGKTDQVRAALRCALLCCAATEQAAAAAAVAAACWCRAHQGSRAAAALLPGTLPTSLSCSTPCISLPPQVEQWQREEIMGFWGRHYFPANATLYVVGDIDVQASCDS